MADEESEQSIKRFLLELEALDTHIEELELALTTNENTVTLAEWAEVQDSFRSVKRMKNDWEKDNLGQTKILQNQPESRTQILKLLWEADCAIKKATSYAAWNSKNPVLASENLRHCFAAIETMNEKVGDLAMLKLEIFLASFSYEGMTSGHLDVFKLRGFIS